MSLGNQPAPYFGEEQAPHLSSAYAYVIEHEDGTQQFWTSYDQPIEITNLPANVVPAESATFLPSQIKHGSITTTDRFESPRATTLSIDSNDEKLRRFSTMAAAVKLRVWILRLSIESMPTSLDFETNALIVEASIISKIAFNGTTVACELTPEPLFVDMSVPRFFAERSCNHPFCGPGCELSRDDWKFDTTILAVDPAARTLTVEGQKAGAAEDYFQAGHLYHDLSKMRLSIGWSAFDGSDTKLKLGYWHPELAVGQTLTAFAGCRHTVEDCTNKFANQANFGGFPYVPNRNPVTNGVL